MSKIRKKQNKKQKQEIRRLIMQLCVQCHCYLMTIQNMLAVAEEKTIVLDS